MPFNGSLNPHNWKFFFYLHFIYHNSLLNPPLKGSLPPYLFSSMCITMWWSFLITKHDYISNVLVLSHNQTWLHITLCIFFNYIFFPSPKPHQKKKRRLELYKKNWTHFFKDQAFSNRVAFKCLHKGLWPFAGADMHKKDVWSPGDVWWGACLP